MRAHVDWLTFTMTLRPHNGSNPDYAYAVDDAWRETLGEWISESVYGELWKQLEKGRAPYTEAWRNELSGMTLYASASLTHCCLEISGQGCERLIEMGMMRSLLERVHERVTRIDIACDIETLIRPTEFTATMEHHRMRSSGYQRSSTGETVYVGSQKSERYSRIYRYAVPHPRAHLLRIETVFRRKEAKAIARLDALHGDDALVSHIGGIMGFSHPIWSEQKTGDVSVENIKAERKMGSTVFWLIKQCAPAFQRMVNDGIIRDPQAFLDTYFLGK